MAVHKLLVTPVIKSGAFSDRLRPGEVARGEPFTITLNVQNLGETKFPGTLVEKFSITYGGGMGGVESRVKTGSYRCPPLNPGESAVFVDEESFIPTEEGLAWVRVAFKPPGEGDTIEYYQHREGERLPSSEWMSPLYVVNRQWLEIVELLEKLAGGRRKAE